MAGSQRELFETPNAVFEHLLKCDVAPVQARLVAYVFEHGREQLVAGEPRLVVTRNDQELAAVFGCSDRAVGKAAAALTRFEWFREVNRGPKKPATYVVDIGGAKSLTTLLDQLDAAIDDNLVAPRPIEPDRTVSNLIEPDRTPSNPIEPYRTGARVRENGYINNPCLVTRDRAREPAAVPRAADPPGPLKKFPWATDGGVTDAELVAACRRADVRFLRHLFAEAVRTRKIVPSDDAWLRFLTACHHAATADNVHRRMGVLSKIVTSGLDVSRTRQRSDDWAARLIASEHRDPVLVALGDRMGRDEE